MFSKTNLRQIIPSNIPDDVINEIMFHVKYNQIDELNNKFVEDIVGETCNILNKILYTSKYVKISIISDNILKDCGPEILKKCNKPIKDFIDIVRYSGEDQFFVVHSDDYLYDVKISSVANYLLNDYIDLLLGHSDIYYEFHHNGSCELIKIVEKYLEDKLKFEDLISQKNTLKEYYVGN